RRRSSMPRHRRLARRAGASPLAGVSVLVLGCTQARPLTGYGEADVVPYPEGRAAVFGHLVEDATLSGTIAGETFAGDARVRAQDGYALLSLELALPTETGAAMHLLEVDAEAFERVEP